MTRTIYLEKSVAEHPRTRQIIKKYPKARIIECNYYGEVFNPRAQNFRLQKQNPALILADKHKNRVLPAPVGYGIGSQHNYYFSHMLNCLYDCRYCFLQGMYRSANYVLFVNYEDFVLDIQHTANSHPKDTPVHFFSGYDCDSMVMEPITGFLDFFLPLFLENSNWLLECRTKSTQTNVFSQYSPQKNIVLAFSFTPENIAAKIEHKTPSVEKRIRAMSNLAMQGWPIGLRFDPLIYTDSYKALYRELFQSIFSVLPESSIHSVSLGSFRMPTGFFQTIKKLYPEEKLFAGPTEKRGSMVTYKQTLEAQMFAFCETELRQYIPAEKYFPCTL